MIVNLYATVRELPELGFEHELNAMRDLTDPELAEHLVGFIGFITSEITQMTQVRYAVIRHIERVQHQVSVVVEPEALPGIAAWATRANALMFLPDGSVRDPYGRLLAASGSDEYDERAQVPYPEAARSRKARSQVRLEALGLEPTEMLPPVASALEIELRDPLEVAARAQALLSVASRALGVLEEEPWSEGALDVAFPLAREAWSPAERAFMAAEPPEQAELVPWVWRYESAWLLLWALKRAEDLSVPAQVVAIEDMGAVANGMREGARWLEGLELRDVGEVLDALDLHVRTHWVVVQRGLSGEEVEGWERGVVYERHLALNWLTGFEGASWDDVLTPT